MNSKANSFCSWNNLQVWKVLKVLLSLYILHNSLLRNIGEERANDEMFVAYNGPSSVQGPAGILPQTLLSKV